MCYFLALQKFLLVEISYKDRHKKIGWKKKNHNVMHSFLHLFAEHIPT